MHHAAAVFNFQHAGVLKASVRHRKIAARRNMFFIEEKGQAVFAVRQAAAKFRAVEFLLTPQLVFGAVALLRTAENLHRLVRAEQRPGVGVLLRFVQI